MGALPLGDDSYPAVHLRRVYLLHASYDDVGAEGGPRERDFVVDLSVGRRSALEITVALTVATRPEAPLRVSATYAADFALPDDVAEAERDEVLRQTAYELAPAVLYSYIRQFFEDVTGRGRAHRITLPFIPIPLEMAGEERPIPPPPAD